MIERIRDEVAKGSQVYWVPLIDETEESDQAADEKPARQQQAPPLDLSNVTQTHQELSEALQALAWACCMGVTCGRKADVMARFSW